MDKTTVYRTDCGHYGGADETRVVNIKVRICNACPMPHLIWGDIEAAAAKPQSTGQPANRTTAPVDGNPFLKPNAEPAPIAKPVVQLASQYPMTPDGVDLTGVNLNDDKTTLLIRDPRQKLEYIKSQYGAAKSNPFLVKGINVEPIDGINDGQVAMVKRSTMGG